MTTNLHNDESPPVHTELDTWHRHDLADGTPQTEHGAHARVGMLFIVFVVLSVSTVAFSVMIAVYSLGQMDKLIGEREAQGLAAVAPEAAAYKANALASQSGYSWTDQGHVKLPIEEAMKLVVQEQGKTPTP